MSTYRAPGRVNLIGGQVDYHEGFVVNMAIDRYVFVEMTPVSDRIAVRSRDYDGTFEIAPDGRNEPRAIEPAWGRMVGGVTRALAEEGRPPVGAALEFWSSLPIGAGLSSSSAFGVACAVALNDAAAWDLDPLKLALAVQHAEHIATDVPCGIQDQIASVMGHADHALFLDCRTLEVEHLPLPDALRVLIMHCGVPRDLGSTPYAQRRAESEAVAHALGLRVLRDATFEQVRDKPRGRHAVTE
ncbi:MAG TPA: galactokinase family protein, partial [Acidimicrobiia bacterium]|nr:galactokinase family protein [Acidimicrobiia bacterium]